MKSIKIVFGLWYNMKFFFSSFCICIKTHIFNQLKKLYETDFWNMVKEN